MEFYKAQFLVFYFLFFFLDDLNNQLKILKYITILMIQTCC